MLATTTSHSSIEMGNFATVLRQLNHTNNHTYPAGDVALVSDIARIFHGLDGTGVTVGVISDSYNFLGGAAADLVSNDVLVGVNN